MSRLTFIYINILCFLCFAGQNCKAQTFMPIITNYNSFSYQFGIQNWSCTQDDKGTTAMSGHMLLFPTKESSALFLLMETEST